MHGVVTDKIDQPVYCLIAYITVVKILNEIYQLLSVQSHYSNIGLSHLWPEEGRLVENDSLFAIR